MSVVVNISLSMTKLCSTFELEFGVTCYNKVHKATLPLDTLADLPGNINKVYSCICMCYPICYVLVPHICFWTAD